MTTGKRVIDGRSLLPAMFADLIEEVECWRLS